MNGTTLVTVLWLTFPSVAPAQEAASFRVLATSRTTTLQKEMQEAGGAGYRFVAVMGGETPLGGNEVLVLMQKTPEDKRRFEYRLLATSKTSTMQRELQEAADAGFEYIGQTVFESAFAGKEVAVILERDPSVDSRQKYVYQLIATKRTSTLQKEIQEAGDQGFEALGLTVGETAIAGGEIVVIMRRRAP